MNKIDINKTYTTRDGRKVRILCVDAPNPKFPVIGLIDGSGGWSFSWTECGTTYADQTNTYKDDLIEGPETLTVEFWVNVYKSGRHAFHNLKSVAEREADMGIFARIHIKLDVTKGSGL